MRIHFRVLHKRAFHVLVVEFNVFVVEKKLDLEKELERSGCERNRDKQLFVLFVWSRFDIQRKRVAQNERNQVVVAEPQNGNQRLHADFTQPLLLFVKT